MEGMFQVSHKEWDGTLTVVGGADFASFWDNLFQAFGEDTANAIIERMKLALLGQPTSHRPEGENQSSSQPQSRGGNNNRQSSGGSRTNNRNQGSRRASNGPPPGQDDPYCDHGVMEWKEFVSAKGNDVAGWFCTETDRDKQCSPVWPGRG